MMYDDIVASTQPLNYNPALFLEKFNYGSAGYYNHGSHVAGFFNDEDDDASVIENGEYEQFEMDDIPSQNNEVPFAQEENYHLVNCGDNGQPTCGGSS